MILSQQSIREQIESGHIGMEPEPEDVQYQPASFDVTLGREVYDLLADERYMVEDELELRPGSRFLGHTGERVSLPTDLAAQVTGRSSFGRLFVTVHQTAGWIDPGYEGQITLEIANFSHQMVTVEPEKRVGQLVFFQLDEPAEQGYDGQYQQDEGAQPSGEL